MSEFFKRVAKWCGDHSKQIATGATIAGGVIMAIGGLASAKNQSNEIDAAVNREMNHRFPPTKN